MYGFSVVLDSGFELTVERVIEALKNQGFGIMSTIDVQAAFKAKIGVEMRPYKILGACNPTFAYKVITAEPEIGLLLPCNVVVRELENGRMSVDFIDPEAMLKLVNNPQVLEVADSVKELFLKVKSALVASE